MQPRARAHTHKHTCYALSRATEEQIFYYRIRFSARQKVKETETIAAAGSVASNYMNNSREKTEKTGESSRRLPAAAGARRRRFKTLVAPSPSSSSPAPRSRRVSTAGSLFPDLSSLFSFRSSQFAVPGGGALWPNNPGRQVFLFRSTSFFLLTPRQVRCLQLAPATWDLDNNQTSRLFGRFLKN